MFQTPIKNIHKTTINPTGFQHHGYLEKMMMVNLNSKKQSLQRLHDQAKTLIFYSFSQTHMRLFLTQKPNPLYRSEVRVLWVPLFSIHYFDV